MSGVRFKYDFEQIIFKTWVSCMGFLHGFLAWVSCMGFLHGFLTLNFHTGQNNDCAPFEPLAQDIVAS